MWTLLTQVDTSRVASLFYLGPPVTFFMAWLIFNDPLLWSDSLGLGIVVLGVTLSQLGDRPKHSSRSTAYGAEGHSPGGLHPQQEPSA
jgi:drug/metabolite transporter (DMT)-like permease